MTVAVGRCDDRDHNVALGPPRSRHFWSLVRQYRRKTELSQSRAGEDGETAGAIEACVPGFSARGEGEGEGKGGGVGGGMIVGVCGQIFGLTTFRQKWPEELNLSPSLSLSLSLSGSKSRADMMSA